jgi:hypothetical protein
VLGQGPAPEVMNRETKHDHLEGVSLLSAGLTPGVEHVATTSNNVDPLGRNLTRDTIYFPGKYILDGFVINHRGPRAGVYSFKTMSVA